MITARPVPATKPASFDSVLVFAPPLSVMLPLALTCFILLAMLVAVIASVVTQRAGDGTGAAWGYGLLAVGLTLTFGWVFQVLRRCLVLGRHEIVEAGTFGSKRLRYADVDGYALRRDSISAGRGGRVHGYRLEITARDAVADPVGAFIADGASFDPRILDRLAEVSTSRAGRPQRDDPTLVPPARSKQLFGAVFFWAFALASAGLLGPLVWPDFKAHVLGLPQIERLERVEGRLTGATACATGRRGDGPRSQVVTLADGADSGRVRMPCVLPEGVLGDGNEHHMTVLHRRNGGFGDTVLQVQLDDRLLIDYVAVKRKHDARRPVYLAIVVLPLLLASWVIVAALTCAARLARRA